MTTKGYTTLREASPEERRLRKRMIDMGLIQKDIAIACGLYTADVNKVIRQKSKTPAYIAEVYKYLGLEQPEQEDGDAP